ncbi:hypothetical protein M8C21_001085 [Ambrosia artemisiifolia]|uniref:Uncharacterized protein n=1 Tax=Ambrosia artemisiifolia TaxID=4212 RepID=A0AAD5BS46_AMBAR|nr:hypothetical protein M8C21_001085 [Ambrosia artemisiifolia]
MEDNGNNAEVTQGSIFNNLAARKVLKCPLEEEYRVRVNSASATTGNFSFGWTGTRRTFKPITLRIDSAAYAYYPSGIWYEDHLEDGRIVRQIKYPRPVKSAPTRLENLLRAANLKR